MIDMTKIINQIFLLSTKHIIPCQLKNPLTPCANCCFPVTEILSILGCPEISPFWNFSRTNDYGILCLVRTSWITNLD